MNCYSIKQDIVIILSGYVKCFQEWYAFLVLFSVSTNVYKDIFLKFFIKETIAYLSFQSGNIFKQIPFQFNIGSMHPFGYQKIFYLMCRRRKCCNTFLHGIKALIQVNMYSPSRFSKLRLLLLFINLTKSIILDQHFLSPKRIC